MIQNKQKHHYFYIGAAILFAVVIFLSKIGVSALNPTYDAWLMTSGSDWTPDYMAWGFYRSSDWTFPLGIFTGYSFPEQVSLGLTGGIPLLAVPLKLFDPLLPKVFQHFGIWLLLCYILQAFFSYHLLRLWGIKDRVLLSLGACFFVISYTLLDRIAHTNLCGHWEILASLCVYFSKSPQKAWWKHGLLIFASVWTHPYLIIFTIFIALADYVKLYLIGKINLIKAGLYIISIVAFAGLAWFLIGNHILESDQARGEGFGVFSANLNTFFTPKTDGGIMPALARYYDTQFEGVAYFGIGILISILFFPFLFFKRIAFFPKINTLKWPLLILALGMFLFSLSNQICLNNTLVLYYKLPTWAMDKASILRASGRYVWLIHYIMLGSFIYVIAQSKLKQTVKYIWLGCVLGITIADFWPQIKPSPFIHTFHPVVEGFEKDFWTQVIDEADDFIMFPAHERNYERYADDMLFAEIAMKVRTKFNSGHLARFNSNIRDQYKKAIQDTIETKPELYGNKTIITSKKHLPIFSELMKQGNHRILEANDYYAFVPRNGTFLSMESDVLDAFHKDTIKIAKEDFGVYTQRNRNNYFLMAVMDEASAKLKSCPDFVTYFSLNKSNILDLGFRESYVGIFKGQELLQEIRGKDHQDRSVKLDTILNLNQNEKAIELFSADKDNGNEARIFVDGINYALNDRGLNIVTINEDGQVIESTRFDTFQECHHETKNSALYYTVWRKM